MMTSHTQKSICVFCGASNQAEKHYYRLAKDCGLEIAKRQYRLVYGGGGVGLMGACAAEVRDHGGEVLGIIPEFLTKIEAQLEGIEQIIVPNMRARKQMMLEQSDAFIVLPGGIGTLEEAIEVLSWFRLHLHDKPMVFVDHNGFWQPLLHLLHHTIATGFAPDWLDAHLLHAHTPAQALAHIEDYWKHPKPRGEVAVKPKSEQF